MRFVGYDELTDRQHRSRMLVNLSSLGGSASPARVARWRAGNPACPDYVGVFALEGREVVGQVIVRRMPYTFATGTETVSGLASVGTRPDRGRHGIARSLLEEVHRRERAAGLRHIFLWTNRSWGAHRLYESLGYRDLFASPWAVQPIRPRPPRGRARSRVRPARERDLDEIARLRASWAADRWGFTPRVPGLFRAYVATGELEPRRDLIVTPRAGPIRGYAHVRGERFRSGSGELVASDPGVAEALIRAIEARARDRSIAFRGTVVRERRSLLRRLGYDLLDDGYWALMGRPLGAAVPEPAARRLYGTQDARFLCHDGDQF